MPRNRPTAIEPLTASIFLMVCLHGALAAGVWWLWHEHHTTGGRVELTWMAPADFKNLVPVSYVPRAIPIAAAPKAAPKATSKSAAPRGGAVKKVVEPEPAPKATLIAAPAAANMPQPVDGTPLFAGSTTTTKVAANRSITLRRSAPKKADTTAVPAPDVPPAPPAKSASLADIVRLQTLRPVEPPPPPPSTDVDFSSLNMDAVDNAVNAVFYQQWVAPPLDAVPEAQRSAQLTISIAHDGEIIGSEMTRPSGSHPLDDSILTAASSIKKIDVTLPSQFRKRSYDLDLTFHLLP